MEALNSPSLSFALDNVCTRFIINLPKEELRYPHRVMFQIEEAHWFYEDFLRPSYPKLPHYNLKFFLLLILHQCPDLHPFIPQYEALYDQFQIYKQHVPVRGCILLDPDMNKVVLVRGVKKAASWSFPRGKINQDEQDFQCARRETLEEVGFDVILAGLADLSNPPECIDITLREQQLKLYIVRGVPLDTKFQTQTRNEIGDIRWYNIEDLPGAKMTELNCYNVAPFVSHLKRWIKEQRKLDKVKIGGAVNSMAEDSGFETDGLFDVTEASRNRNLEAELKKMLNIGTNAVTTLKTPKPCEELKLSPTKKSLMHLLQQPSTLPPTPLEQIQSSPQAISPHKQVSSFIPQPAFPPPFTNGSSHQPHYPYLQQQPYSQQNPLGPHHSLPVHHHDQYHQPPPPPYPPPPYNLAQYNNVQQFPSQLSYGPPPTLPVPGLRQSPLPHTSAPISSQSATPKLTAHRMALLDAFKTDERPQKVELPATSVRTPATPFGQSRGHLSSTSIQQKALLNLFKSPSSESSPMYMSTLSAELSAGTPNHLQDISNQSHVSAESLLTSATVSGPLNAPDFATLQTSSKTGQVNEGAPSMPPTHMRNQIHPLKAPRPFHPTTILQRQQQFPANKQPSPSPVTSALTSATTGPSALVRQSANMPSQKAALLSLFGTVDQSKIQKLDPSQASINSRSVSPLVEKRTANQSMDRVQLGSQINNHNFQAQSQFQTSGQSSSSASRRNSITAEDKRILFQFLEGVVEESKKCR